MSGKSISITYKNYMTSALVYLTLPIVIFMFGFLKVYYAIIFSGLLIASCVYAVMDSSKGRAGKIKDRSLQVTPVNLIVVTLITIFLLFFAGIGEFGYCLDDHTVRYAILNDLVNYKWPVIYDFNTQTNPIVIEALGDGKVAFSYYFAFWMVPALVGKIFGLMAARVAILIWSVIGIILVTIGLYFYAGKSKLMLFVGMMLFAGFDLIPFLLYLPGRPEITFEGWNYHMFIHGNLYQLFNVYNQSIPGWLIAILLLTSRNNRSLGLFGGLMFCYSPWATIGMVPVCIERLLSKGHLKKNLLTVGNLLAPVAAIVCFGLLYTANSNATSDSGLIWNFYDSPLLVIKDYVGYVIFEFGIWAIFLFNKHKKNSLYWVCVGTLLVMPIYKITASNDFLMRGSMIPMFILSIYAINQVVTMNDGTTKNRKEYLKGRGAYVLLFTSAFVGFTVLVLSISASISIWSGTMESLYKDIDSFGNINKEQELQMVQTQFYVYDYEESPFFKYLAK